jgi:hypothetical protein
MERLLANSRCLEPLSSNGEGYLTGVRVVEN